MFIYASNIIMFKSMVRSKKYKHLKRECSKKSSELIWKMPERILDKKYQYDKKKYSNVKFVDQYA